MDATGFEEIEHTADWALRVMGADLSSLLVHAAQGMVHLAGAVPGEGPRRTRPLRLDAIDPESLLVAWLEELLFRIEQHAVVPTAFDVTTTDGGHLEAEITEAPLVSLKRDIKAVTFHDLKIEETTAGLSATVVFDV